MVPKEQALQIELEALATAVGIDESQVDMKRVLELMGDMKRCAKTFKEFEIGNSEPAFFGWLPKEEK